jgi:hypothetical protein
VRTLLDVRGTRIRPYAALYERARALTRGARSPYEAAVALELWLRTAGGFRYDEQPPQADGGPPLVAFVTRTKAGYCQHFAGAMALMLRFLGVPARVAAGFTSGTYDASSGVWSVTDHDAHTWVEAWFDGYGWLPFDPTPGRGSLDGSYTVSSRRFELTGAGGKSLSQLLKVPQEELQARIARGGALQRAEPARRAAPSALARRGSNLALLLLLIATGAVAAIAVAKATVRRTRYLTRDPRRVAAACRRELVDFLRDQRIEASPGATLAELERTLLDTLAVSGSHFAEAATAARFAPPDRAADGARRSRRELRVLLRALRRRLTATERARGFLSLRSLGFR